MILLYYYCAVKLFLVNKLYPPESGRQITKELGKAFFGGKTDSFFTA